MVAKTTKLTYEFPQLDGEAKLRELILYIADKYVDAPKFGMTKLNKTLYFADSYWYKRTGKPITGVKYMRLDNGAVPQRMKYLLEKMVDNGDIIIKTNPLPRKYTQDRVIAKETPNLDQYFTPSQIAWVDKLIELLWDESAEEVSEASHGIAWRVYDIQKEPIPYEASLLSDEPITMSDIERTGELAEKYGW